MHYMQNLERNGKRNTCPFVENKIIFGEIQEPLKTGCGHFDMTEKEKYNRAYKAYLRRLPVTNSELRKTRADKGTKRKK